MLRLRSLCCLLSLDFCQLLLGTSTREKGSNFLLLGVSCVCECVGAITVRIVSGIYTFTAVIGNDTEGEHPRPWRG